MSLTFRVQSDHGRVWARFRPFPSNGRPDRSGPIISLHVDAPETEDRWQWIWSMQMESSRFHILDMPDDVREISSKERYVLLGEMIHDIGVRRMRLPDKGRATRG